MKLVVGTVHPGTVSFDFCNSISRLLRLHPEIDFIAHESGVLIASARNSIADWFLQSEHTHLLFVDSDVGFDTSDVEAICGTDEPIVSAWCNTSHGRPAVFFRTPEGGLRPAKRGDMRKRELQPVEAVGMAFTLIRRDVMETLGTGVLWPFAEIIGDDGKALGEDVTFCIRAKDKGFDSFVRTDIRVSHYKSVRV